MSDEAKKPDEEKPDEGKPKLPGTRRTESDATEIQPGEAGKLARKTKPGSEKELPVDESWITNRSDDTLVSLITAFAVELKSRAQKITERRSIDKPMPEIETDVQVKEFVRLPATSKKTAEERAETTWRIALYSEAKPDEPLGVELYDNVMIGRQAEGVKIDLDLTEHDAEELGVSRIHAMLRPTKSHLILVDLDSTNGTYCEGGRVKASAPVELKDGNMLTLGKLHFKVKVVSQPKPKPKSDK